MNHFICNQRDMRRVANCKRWKKKDLMDSDHRAMLITLRVACKLQKRRLDNRTKLITRDYSSITGACKEAHENKVKFAKAVLTKVKNSDPSMTKHGALSNAPEETSAELPKVGKKSPPPRWFCEAKEELEPLLKKRNECVEENMTVSRLLMSP
jgi:hypothetical protein